MMNAARRLAANPAARRNLSTAAAKEAFPYRGIGHGGHMQQLQKEPSFAGYWVNFKASPEVIPVVACVAFACGLAAYKTVVVDTVGTPFVDRAKHFEK